MRKKVVRLTESQLKNIIAESVKMIFENMTEEPPKTYDDIYDLVAEKARSLGCKSDRDYIKYPTTIAYDYTDGNYLDPPDWKDKDIYVDIPMEYVIETIENLDSFPSDIYGEEPETYQWIKENLSEEMLGDMLEDMHEYFIDESVYYEDDDYEHDEDYYRDR